MSNQIVVIGMDGADPDLTRRWASEGKLPAIQSLLDRGAGGVLWSSPNAMSPAAWSSFATGLNPGRHGIFYFLDRKPGTYDLMHSGSATRSGQTFWRAMSQAGKRVAVLHEPISYPAEPINGMQVCGWLAPNPMARGFTHPPDLAAEIRRLFPDLALHTGVVEYVRRNRFDLALSRKLKTVRAKGKMARWAWEQGEWDCFVTVFDETDPISHYFWHFMDEAHPAHPGQTAHRYDTAIEDVYRAVDEEIGRMLELIPPSAHVFIMSDHGSRRNSGGQLCLKGLLRELGLEVATERKAKQGLGNLALKAAERVPSSWRHLARGLLPGVSSRMLRTSAAGDIDYPHTRAYTFWCNGCAEPFLNIAGREPQGILRPGAEVDEVVGLLRQALLQAEDAKTGEKLVASVERATDIYAGPHVDRAPDLLVTWTDAVVQGGLRTQVDDRELVIPAVPNLDWRTGNHRREGLLIAAGPQVAAGATPGDVSITDLPATFLAMLDVPAPGELDGKVRHDLISGLQDVTPAQTAVEEQPAEGYTADEEAAIEERLADLGYL